MIRRKPIGFSFILVLLLIINGCIRRHIEPQYVNQGNNKLTDIRFAVLPYQSQAKTFETYQPSMDYLNTHIRGAYFHVIAYRDYKSFEDNICLKGNDFLVTNSFETLKALKSGYHVLATEGNKSDSKCIFLVRKDSNIHRPIDLKGKSVSYTSKTAIICLLAQNYLYLNGIDVNRDIVNRYVGSHESSIMNVYMGMSSVGTTWPPAWKAFQQTHTKEAAELKVIWETKPIITNSLMARDDVPKYIKEKTQTLLINFQRTKDGQILLNKMETSCINKATDKDFDCVKSFVQWFNTKIRKIE